MQQTGLSGAFFFFVSNRFPDQGGHDEVCTQATTDRYGKGWGIPDGSIKDAALKSSILLMVQKSC